MSHVSSGSFKPHGVFQVGGDGDPRQIGLTAPQVSCLSESQNLKSDPIRVTTFLSEVNKMKSPEGHRSAGGVHTGEAFRDRKPV